MQSDPSHNPSRVKNALDALAARGIDLPAAVTKALKELHRIEALEPQKPTTTQIREHYLAGATSDIINAAVLAELGHGRLRTEWAQARITAAGTVLWTLKESTAELFPKLRAQADANIAKLKIVAALGSGATLDTLIRSGKTDEARIVADLSITATDLDALYSLRDQYLVPGGFGKLTVNNINASRWKDPEKAAQRARGNTTAEQFVSGLRAGIELWFPTPAEAIDAAQVIANRRTAEAQQRAHEQFGVGSTATFASW